MMIFKFDNLAEVDRLLGDLPEALRRTAFESAVRSAAKVVVKRAKELCPPPGYPGDKPPWGANYPENQNNRDALKPLRDTIGFVMRRYSNDSLYMAVVGPMRPAGAHGHLVEYGTKRHEIIASAYVSRVPFRRGRARDRIIREETTKDRKRVLARKDVNVIFGSRVQHPGSAPYPFLGPAAEQTKADQTAEMVTRISKAINDFMKTGASVA